MYKHMLTHMLTHMLNICSQSFKMAGDFSTSANLIGGTGICTAYAKTSTGVEPDALSICRGSTPVEL